jgi:hypothetical protein
LGFESGTYLAGWRPGLIRDERFGDSMRRLSVRDLPIAQTKRVANGALTMQAAPCGHRAGISGPFHETLATDQPYMRQRKTLP